MSALSVVSDRLRTRPRSSTALIVVGVIALALLVFVVPGVATEEKRFTLSQGIDVQAWSFDPRVLSAVLCAVVVVVAVAHPLVTPGWLRTGLASVAAVTVVLLILTLALSSSDQRTANLFPLVAEGMIMATPIALGAMCGMWSERSGVLNIGIEGMMLTSACAAYSSYVVLNKGTGGAPLWLSVLIGIVMGGIVGLLHAWLCITMNIDQVISGVAINLLATGLSGFVRGELTKHVSVQGITTMPSWHIPLLHDLPVVGPTLFEGQPIYFAGFLIIPLCWVLMWKTRWGMRVRACGENPWAAESTGINVVRTRYQAVVFGGVLAGLAGVWFTLEANGTFREDITSGYGFISLAAVIVGKWRPFHAWAGSFLFAFSLVLGSRLQIMSVSIWGYPFPSEAAQMVPYLTTLLIVAGFVGRSRGPAASGQPYIRSH